MFNVIASSDAMGSNCVTQAKPSPAAPIPAFTIPTQPRVDGGCGGTQFGCCPGEDMVTGVASSDAMGSNCVTQAKPSPADPIPSVTIPAQPLVDGDCGGTQFGCCPGEVMEVGETQFGVARSDAMGSNCAIEAKPKHYSDETRASLDNSVATQPPTTIAVVGCTESKGAPFGCCNSADLDGVPKIDEAGSNCVAIRPGVLTPSPTPSPTPSRTPSPNAAHGLAVASSRCFVFMMIVHSYCAVRA
jgi:hypothetical protein